MPAAPGAFALRRYRGFGLFHDRLERRRLGDGEIGQDLAVDRQPGLGEAVDEPAVVQSERPHRGVEPFGRKYFLMLSPSVLNSVLVPRNWRIAFLVRLIMP